MKKLIITLSLFLVANSLYAQSTQVWHQITCGQEAWCTLNNRCYMKGGDTKYFVPITHLGKIVRDVWYTLDEVMTHQVPIHNAYTYRIGLCIYIKDKGTPQEKKLYFTSTTDELVLADIKSRPNKWKLHGRDSDCDPTIGSCNLQIFD